MWYFQITAIILCLMYNTIYVHGRRKGESPLPTYRGNFADNYPRSDVENRVASWTPAEKNNAWELSGLLEGDIMLAENADFRNVIYDESKYWTEGVVPYHIEKGDFSYEQREVIKNAIDEYHSRTCIKFRPYVKEDKDYIVIRSNSSGCWSYVGRHGGGQVVNLQKPGCVHQGIVTHELLHALGFYHQHSAFDRDDYIKINYENIKYGKEHNFRKYNTSVVTDFNVGYDYRSIMHYSAYAFSKNGEPTIEPHDKDAKIGQRDCLSKKDIKKISKMYHCGEKEDSLWYYLGEY